MTITIPSTVTDLVQQIEESAKNLANSKRRNEPKLVLEEHTAPLTWIAQGDMNITFLGSELPNVRLVHQEQHPLRLVPGPETRGSSHCLRHQDVQNIEYFAHVDRQSPSSVLRGPVIKLLAGRTMRITHPEHQDYEFGPYNANVVMQITYQLGGLQGDQIVRAMD